MMKKLQKGFTLIELMVVIVIISVLSALAVPKMFGTSAKAKAAEAPSVISTWETLQTTYVHELGRAGNYASIGFTNPSNSVSGVSRWFDYTDGGASAVSSTITAITVFDFGDCAVGNTFQSELTVAGGVIVHSAPIGICASSYTPNFLP